VSNKHELENSGACKPHKFSRHSSHRCPSGQRGAPGGLAEWEIRKMRKMREIGEIRLMRYRVKPYDYLVTR